MLTARTLPVKLISLIEKSKKILNLDERCYDRYPNFKKYKKLKSYRTLKKVTFRFFFQTKKMMGENL